ncbi:hypothetical protein Pfo_022609 [Paulownia fortunei]|nr:hypothetical protein Pfo_022609 [Paulownia fortunei]
MDATLGVILTSIFVAASITWAVKLLNWLWFRPRKLEKLLRKQGLNGNPYRPFLGDFKDYIKVIKAEQRRSIKLSDDILPHIFAYYHEILTMLIKEILWKPDVFQKPHPELGKILAGGGLLFLEGEKWAKHRKIINPAFHLEKLKNMVPAIGLSCSSMIVKWKAMVSSSNEGWCEIDIWPYLEDLTGDVISRTAFGSSHEEGRRIFQLQRDNVMLTLQLLQFLFIPGWRYFPTKVNRKVKAMTNEIQSLLRGIINKRQKAMERGEAIPGNDLLGILLESNSRFSQDHGNKNAGMSVEDTTASLLVWTMVLLCKHPEWQTQAREEVNGVFGNSEPSFEGLNHLKTVRSFLRLYPPGPLLVRGPTKTVKLGNITIPTGVQMTLLIGLLHRDPEIWGDDANEFKPQRFSEGVSNAAKIQSSFKPFSSGPRVCIGQNIGMIEAKMALAMILQHFSFELSPSYLHAPFAVLTLQPQYGAPIILRSLKSLSRS